MLKVSDSVGRPYTCSLAGIPLDERYVSRTAVLRTAQRPLTPGGAVKILDSECNDGDYANIRPL